MEAGVLGCNQGTHSHPLKYSSHPSTTSLPGGVMDLIWFGGHLP
jgi:hypothetical protein